MNIMNNIIILGGGPYIQKVTKEGCVEKNYGWSELHISGLNVKVQCIDDNDYERYIINFDISTEIPRDYKYLEKLQIYLKNGFGSIYAYNYAKIDKFKKGCQEYFNNLCIQIINDKQNTICDKCKGTGKI